jgi:bifunctional UDP-N-acetylglucosamine pyrophosphorylase/glucosamine-1-phosphate N-acetyltransferase
MISTPIAIRRTLTEPLQVALLAAGEGKRMHSALPKALHPLAGRPLAAHVLAAVRTLSPRTIVIVTGIGAAMVEDALAAPDVRFARQDPPRGTGDAARVALAALASDGVTLIALSDVPLVPPEALGEIVASAQAGKLALLTADVSDPRGLGRIVRDAEGNVRAIVEERDASESERALGEINTGFLAAPTARLATWLARLTTNNAQREYYLTDVVAMAVEDGVPVVATRAADEISILGINDRAQLAALERIVQRRAAEALMRAGTTIADPARIDIRGELSCGRDVSIDVGCIFEGDVRLGDSVTIEPYCVLRDVSLGAESVVGAYSHLEQVSAGARCRIGPYARMRPGSELADEVHIGNFVEVKASALGKGAKANHLAYIGDARLGERVNFGAGAITANYDGANKHRTIIGDDAHIGSNSVLIAPVQVGSGATVGGGSTIAEDAPADALTVARARAVTVKGWKRPAKKKV